jgi:hypothetical protein
MAVIFILAPMRTHIIVVFILVEMEVIGISARYFMIEKFCEDLKNC